MATKNQADGRAASGRTWSLSAEVVAAIRAGKRALSGLGPDCYFPASMDAAWNSLIALYKADEESVYNTWFIDNADRLKAFRSVRRGVAQVIEDIRKDRFGNDFKGSSLEFVLHCITEQKQVFEGAAHPFYWKPKLRIPDIYEHRENQLAFGQFLDQCMNATREDQLVKEILRLDQLKIKGLGPAVASILYFLHPTLIPPCNTGIVNGYNALYGENRKLGSWQEYLAIREGMLARNTEFRKDLSRDLGAIAGLLFDIGSRKLRLDQSLSLPPEERKRMEASVARRHKEVVAEREEEGLHTEMQYHLLKIGKALGCDVISAMNDRSRSHLGRNFSFLSLPAFPDLPGADESLSTIKLVDVLWFEKGTNRIVCAFEVEKSTSIFSGILRLTDLSLSLPEDRKQLYLVVPDQREREVFIQLTRPSLKGHGQAIRYILFSDLRTHCEALCRFGENPGILEKIAKQPVAA